MGFFKYVNKSLRLNGYGKDWKTNKEGLFEDGSFNDNGDNIKSYDYEMDYIARKINF